MRTRNRARAKGKKARIVAKMNDAGRAGNDPGAIQGLAGRRADRADRARHVLAAARRARTFDNIRVHSVIGRFLEHHRAFLVRQRDRSRTMAVQRDWMERNLFRRVEIAFPILDRKLRRTASANSWKATSPKPCRAGSLQPDGSYVRASAGKDARPGQERAAAVA